MGRATEQRPFWADRTDASFVIAIHQCGQSWEGPRFLHIQLRDEEFHDTYSQFVPCRPQLADEDLRQHPVYVTSSETKRDGFLLRS